MFTRTFIRRLATTASREGVIKPPVQLFGLEGTYATALYSAAYKTTNIDSAFSSLKSLTSAIKQDSKLKGILENPTLNAEDRQVVSSTLSTLAEDKAVDNLLTVLGENNRLSLLPKISEEFGKLHSAYHGVIEATVVSAVPLESKILKRLQKSISGSSLVGEGKTLQLKNVVKPEIQGGLVVEVGDKTVDVSVASKITKLNQILNETI
ncbi:probable ATP synthase subunit 5, mitochondrial [Saccharomycodes ludwigii]|uniref:ATP synthase subunit 5, mitochondrial n=1 Tax=Saccharomycodes ludwigii TaxID=36035 RepID=A0A376B457_9ASCO|nr:hypothetical protein SCDLUD_004619 [Saccharomycodes ludwigii]KAH3899189.1 hypothetical protein SCDLUD_004619 [Saccharomycodes ludwigii]SSD59359.1 probable ATP synthase subunit 5, mitochondrial [Saccharomycodes ludwigii]